MFIHEKSQAHQCLHYSPGDGSPESICKSRPTKVSHDPGQNREVCTREPIAFEWHRRISETSGTPGRLATSRVTWNGASMVHYMWFTRSAIHVISARTLLYAGRGSIPVRTFLGSKNRLCPIRMRTQVPKFAQQSDPKCGHKRPVGSEVRSRCGHLWRLFDQVPHPYQHQRWIFFLLNAPLSSTITAILLCATRSTFYQNEHRGSSTFSSWSAFFKSQQRVSTLSSPHYQVNN